ncbi:hypothetical protein AAG906_007116 [Vitis piasezkii]
MENREKRLGKKDWTKKLKLNKELSFEGFERSLWVSLTKNHHRLAVAASAVQGAYNLEYDRQESQHPRVQSSHWWHFFHFELKRKLKDDEDSSIYSVVYEMKSIYPNHLPERAPKYIIAFRGTIPTPWSTVRQDLKLNIKVLTDELHMDKTFPGVSHCDAGWKIHGPEG